MLLVFSQAEAANMPLRLSSWNCQVPSSVQHLLSSGCDFRVGVATVQAVFYTCTDNLQRGWHATVALPSWHFCNFNIRQNQKTTTITSKQDTESWQLLIKRVCYAMKPHISGQKQWHNFLFLCTCVPHRQSFHLDGSATSM